MQTLPEFIHDALRTFREHAFAERLGAPDWTFTSSQKMLARAGAIAHALRGAGIGAGDRVALISNNRVDWVAANFGILFAGCVVVPIFATLALDQVDYIFKDSQAKMAFVETPADAERFSAGSAGSARSADAPRFIHFDGSGADSLAEFERTGAAANEKEPAALASFTANTTPDDLAVLIYTSGTTGNPKGVMLLHRNSTSNARSAFEYGLTGRLEAQGEVVLSVLPFAHIYEFNDILGFLLFKCDIYISQPDYLLDDLRSVRPRTMALVPRIFERILGGIVGSARAEGGLKAKLVPRALGVARESMLARVENRKPGGMLPLQYALAQRLVFSKIKSAIGLDRLAFFSSGSAPLHRDIALTFAGMGLPICEGYGLTETAPVLTVNRWDGIRYGSVGKPIPGVEIKLAPDGEILARGPNVMRGYYNLPAEHPFTSDGWFMTGDIGEIDADGYLFITDRKKELIKTSAGKYIAPGRVEAALKRSIYVGQCFIIGEGRPYPIALVCPNWDLVRKDFAIPAEVPTAVIAARSDVREVVSREVRAKTADLGSFEQIRRVALLPRDLTIEDGELSPTMKVKRRVVEKKFADVIESAYAPASKELATASGR